MGRRTTVEGGETAKYEVRGNLKLGATELRGEVEVKLGRCGSGGSGGIRREPVYDEVRRMRSGKMANVVRESRQHSRDTRRGSCDGQWCHASEIFEYHRHVD